MIVTPETLVKEQCQTEINAVLAKYRMRLDPFLHVTSAGMAIGLNLMPQSAPVAPAAPASPVSTGEGRADA
jgi:hypothetical protein